MELPVHGAAGQRYLSAADVLHFLPGQGACFDGRSCYGPGIFAALFWKHISPWEINSLLPALVYNLFFYLSVWRGVKKGNRSEKAAFTASGLLAKSSLMCYIIDKGQPPTSVGCQSFFAEEPPCHLAKFKGGFLCLG